MVNIIAHKYDWNRDLKKLLYVFTLSSLHVVAVGNAWASLLEWYDRYMEEIVMT